MNSETGQQIRVSLDTDPRGWACVEVADSGRGIPREIRERIFDPFFTTKPVGEGTGLGLTLVRTFVSEVKGRIEVLDRPGDGTIFRVALPPA